MKAYARLLAILVILSVSAIVIMNPLAFTGFFAYTSGASAGLAIWDSADQEGGSFLVYAEGSSLGSGPGTTSLPTFYANYTNITSGESINGTGIECNISFNVSGWTTPEGMAFNATSRLYEYDKTFASRGFYQWNASCYGSSQGFDNLGIADNITVSNTPAKIYVPLVNKTCYEDSVCGYNFSANCSDDDQTDRGSLIYGYEAGTQFPGFSINTATGNVTVSITSDSGCGNFRVSLTVRDPPGDGALANKSFIVNAVNDLPVIGSLPSSSNQNSSLYYDVNANDEETPSGPFFFGAAFVSCYRPFNSQHTNATDCSSLFSINSSNGVINRSVIFSNSEVGNYTVNFTVTDPGDNLTGTSIPPYTWLANKTGWQLVNFSVVDLNDQPSISPVPGQVWQQNQSVVLVINASDIDNGTLAFSSTALYRNLSAFSHNTSLFLIALNQTIHLDNGTSLGNATISLDPVTNGQVGNYTLNISVYDGRENGTNSILVNLTVTNINDPPDLNFSCRNYSVEGLGYLCDTGQNTTDPDDFPPYVPYSDLSNSTLTFSINFTACAKANSSDTNCTIFGINQTTGLINYTNPLRKDEGNYTLNVSVADGGGLTAWTLFNLTVVADYAPELDASIPPQTTTQNQPFLFSVNATDADNATDTLAFRTETYFNGTLLNSTLFPIETALDSWPPGPATGVMNYPAISNSQVGNYTVKITVNDSWGREDYATVNFTVYNVNDPPGLNFSCLNYTNEYTIYQQTRYECAAGENSTDIDQQTPYGDNLTYGLTFIAGNPLFSINITTGVINFTAWNDTWANNTLNFTYVLNVTMTDSGGLADSRILNITVYAANDPPSFNFTNTSVYSNYTFFENLSAETADEENNLPFFYNISFLNCTKENVSDTNCTIFGINSSTGVISFYALEKDAGNYTLNVSVSDSGNTTQPHNATGWGLVGLMIVPINHAPSVHIVGVIPSSSFAENETVIFAISVSDQDGDALYCTWFRNLTQVGAVDNCQGHNSWSYTPGFDESGSWTMRLEATDSKVTSYSTYAVTIANTNRPPEFIYPIQNQSWNMNTVDRNIVLSYNIRDPDNENGVTNDDNNLTINYTALAHIVVLIDNMLGTVTLPPSNWTGRGAVTLTPTTDWYGMDYIIFAVNDSSLIATSNNISLNVSRTETQTQTIVQQTGGGGGSVGVASTKVASLTISISHLEGMGSYNKTKANVTLKNTGEVALNGINIDASVKESGDIIPSLDRRYVSQLGIGESANTTLTLTSFGLTKESYEIKVSGMVTDPKFNQSATLYIKTLFNETKFEDRIKFVKDLFEDNPECTDLMELIVQAEKEVKASNMEKAAELTQAALDNCRDIISYANATGRTATPEPEKVPVNEMVIGVLAIALFSILAYLLIERRAGAKVKKG
jgi:hypothetical protein